MRCARAQYSSGVLLMASGTALFDAVAISNTEARVRAGWGGDVSRADCGERGCVGWSQMGGGVVRMRDGAVTFKGGTISNTTAVRALLLRLLHVCRMLQLLMLYAACYARQWMRRGGHATQRW